jgi:hypothetical protein
MTRATIDVRNAQVTLQPNRLVRQTRCGGLGKIVKAYDMHIVGRSFEGGDRRHEPSSYWKKKIASEPTGLDVSTQT